MGVAMPAYGPGTVFYARGGPEEDLTDEDIVKAIKEVSAQLGEKKSVCIVPPDYTRMHSMAGKITRILYEEYGDAVKDVLPALGSHVPVSISEKDEMFKGVPHDLFRVHNWRTDVESIGAVPG